ncbi:MAG: TrbG/VirB9 family P-type conjugative transfer protein [Brevundimonas sp.]|uniref:TrbG/VirB9 family P-type conjugative transfer protein n=1 Tax=Brevundimonas sp. TaxID=1871086 RepID=UPI00391D8F58
MDARCKLIAAAGALTLAGCATTQAPDAEPPEEALWAVEAVALGPLEPVLAATAATDPATGPVAAATAVEDERRTLAWAPGRAHEVRAAPLRVTTLTLPPGEMLLSKAAGDTVRWQIGEVLSGEGETAQAHVLVKPLERGLRTNLVLATNRWLYLVELQSGGPAASDAVVTWDLPASTGTPVADVPEPPAPMPDLVPRGPVNAAYRITPPRRPPAWTPTAVFDDGARTFIVFPPDLGVLETPALFVLAPGGARRTINYRQSGAILIADRLFDRAELILGGARPQVIRLDRLGTRP